MGRRGTQGGGGERVPGRNRDLKQAEQLRIATSKKKKACRRVCQHDKRYGYDPFCFVDIIK